jgi:condensin complex subunit 3
MPSAVATSGGSKNAVLDGVPTTMPPHFQQAQHSAANHRKNIVSLHRLHLACSAFSEQTAKGTRMVGEKVFNEAFLNCLNRVLNLKKGVSNADRVLKFTAAYSKYTQEQFRIKAREARAAQQEEDDGEEEDEEEEEDTTATRFVAILLKHLLRGFGAKDKNVRLRCCQAVALLISGLESIDDELFETLRAALLLRASDKESSVRVQAIIALAKLQSGDDDEEGMELDDESSLTTTDILIRLLRHDPSAEVRRAALFNLSPTEETLPFILERLHDVDTINRRCLYLGSFSNAAIDAPNSQFKMTPAQWSNVIKTGLGERESSVVRATKKLIASWINAEGDKSEAERFLSRFENHQKQLRWLWKQHLKFDRFYWTWWHLMTSSGNR